MSGTVIFDRKQMRPRKRSIRETKPILYAHSESVTLNASTEVTRLIDVSGNGNHLDVVAAESAPAWTADSVNGRPSIDFTGTEALEKEFSAAVEQGYTIALVAKLTTTALQAMFATPSGNNVWVSSSGVRWRFYAEASLDGVNADTSWHVFLHCADGDESINSVDGQEIGGAAGSFTLSGARLGSGQTDSFPMTGSIAAVIVWDRKLNPHERRLVGAKLANRYGLRYGRMKAIVRSSATELTCRIPWDATNDYITGMDLHYSTDTDDQYVSNRVAFLYSGLVAATTADASVTATPTTILRDERDDQAPMRMNGTYIGGTHGAFKVVQVTATSHGKDATDYGSEWTDGSGTKYYILRAVDANTLWVLSENSSDTDWTFDTSISGNLTHSSGAAHTTGITVAGTATIQFFPAVNHTSRKILLNGSTEVTADGVYQCDYVDVIDQHTIKDLDAQLAAAIAGVGTEIDYADASIGNLCTVDICYRWQPNGAVTVDQTVTFERAAVTDKLLFLQAIASQVPASGTRYLYMPKVDAFTPGATEYDFEAIVDVTTVSETVNVETAAWTAAADPPNRFVEYTKTSVAALYSGIAFGFDSTKDDAVPATRAANTDNAFWIYTSGKMYPQLANDAYGNVADGDVFTARCFRCPLNFTKYPTPTSVALWQSGGEWMLAVDFHANHDAYVALPPYLVGKIVRVVEKHANMTVNSATVADEGISFTVINDYGWAVVRIS